MKMIKKKERERMSHIIVKDIWDRLVELAKRAEERNINPAYKAAFQMGLQGDIEDSLRKCRVLAGDEVK